ncbi:cation:proton antiporter [Candidatus Villigracilis affinis]|jgi:Kef-type K+ transport system membrane component KefB|uniref:cation:proton antiporter n=1 Tax=Candidatus Villigracilis affinis TaxID=3140682 RepID=UPI001DECFA33|nr:cation:proton antiporter [Anaerolineales bacterium]
MTLFLQLAFLLSIILLSAKMAGYLSIRMGQPSVLGELLVGIILGPSIINVLNLPFIEHELAETVAKLGELGVLLLMFLAGLELHLGEMRKNLRVAAFAGLMGVFWPVLLGWGAGLLFGLNQPASIFLGLTLGATSVSISAQTLIELKALRTRVGLSLLGAAVFDDILIILLLSVFLALQGGGGSASDVLLIVVRMILFLVTSVAFGLWILPWVIRRFAKLPISQGLLTVSLVIMLTYGIAAEYFGGMAAITGAFLAGLMLARTHEKERIETGMHALAYGLFVPIFFVNIGLSIDLREFQLQGLFFTVVIILVAVIGKWVGSGWGARLGGLSRHESIQLGAGMISRGEVGLIVASVGMKDNLVTAEEFSAIVVMVLVTTLITPPILRALFSPKEDTIMKKADNVEQPVELSTPNEDAKEPEAS